MVCRVQVRWIWSKYTATLSVSAVQSRKIPKVPMAWWPEREAAHPPAGLPQRPLAVFGAVFGWIHGRRRRC